MSSIFLIGEDRLKRDGPTADVQIGFQEKLKEISEQIKKDGVSVPDVLRPLAKHVIQQCLIGGSHLAFLLDDGRVCRVTYSLKCDTVQKSESKRKSTQSESLRDPSSNRSLTTQFSGRPRSSVTTLSRNSRGLSFLQREMQRQGIYITRSVSSQIPASEVPESLIEQCQTVLEGKSREVIIRELQHTNLDVNTAVNNLLSRDDEAEQSNGTSAEGDLGELGSATELWSTERLSDYIPFPNLFDSDVLDSHEPIEPPTSPRLRGESSEFETNFLTGRRKRRRIESQLSARTTEPYQPSVLTSSDSATERLDSDNVPSSGVDSASSEEKSSPAVTKQVIQLGDRLEFWPAHENFDSDPRFSRIAALQSELIGLSLTGELHQWRWADPRPFPPTTMPSHVPKKSADSGTAVSDSGRALTVYYHPRVPGLGLLTERISLLSACSTRATVMTTSGKFASWTDEGLTRLLPVHSGSRTNCRQSQKLLCFEHRATLFSELRDEKILELTTAPLITAIRCQSGAVFWWGIYPPDTRQRTIEKSRQHRSSSSRRESKKSPVSRTSNSSRRSVTAEPRASSQHIRSIDITPGSFVRMKNAPIFHAGAVGFTVVGGVPKVGTLLEDAWKVSAHYLFRVNPDGVSTTTGHDSMASTNPTGEDISQHTVTCPHALAANAQSASTAASPNPSCSSYEQSGSGNAASLCFQEMPPPPSPASSTCSDQSGPVRVSPGTFKRKKAPSTSSDRGERATSDGELGGSSRSVRGRSVDRDPVSMAVRRLANESGDLGARPPSSTVEEQWLLSDVVFVEDGRTQPIGIVLKVDGNIAAVKFLKDQERACLAANCPFSPVCSLVNNIVNSGQSTPQNVSAMNPNLPDPMAWVNDCRLLRKDDLTLVRYDDSSRVPEFVQRIPRKIFSSPRVDLTHASKTAAKPTTTAPVHPVKIVSMAPENNCIHVIVDTTPEHPSQQQLVHHVYNLSGKLLTQTKLPAINRTPESSMADMSLTCPAEHPFLLRDSLKLVVPFVPANTDPAFALPCVFDLPPIQCAAFSWIPNQKSTIGIPKPSKTTTSDKPSERSGHFLFSLIIVRDLALMPHVLRGNEAQVERLISSDPPCSTELCKKLSLEMINGQRNLLHVAVSMCVPQSNVETTAEWLAKLDPILAPPVSLNSNARTRYDEKLTLDSFKRCTTTPSVTRPSPALWSSVNRPTTQSNNLSMHEVFIRSSIEAATAALNADDSASSRVANGTNFWHWPPVRLDDLNRRAAAYRIVRLLVEARYPGPFLSQLLAARDMEGLTPFMLAVNHRAYGIARFLYDAIQNLILNVGAEISLKDFVFPLEFNSDDSPLYQLCCNDTCSFTWTGPHHIRQDIFECRTCGLMDSLCCCTECARVCHRGHDCRLKRTSPTAYCDCWEKCRCRSLISGSQSSRHELFYRLLNDTDLVHVVNSKNEHLILFLVKRVERQIREQKHQRPQRRRFTALNSRSSATPVSTSASTNWDVTNDSGSPDEPDHDLDPPRFARDALKLTLDSPAAVESLMNLSFNTSLDQTCSADEVKLLNTQAVSSHLDEFVLALVCKCPVDFLDILLNTFSRVLSLQTSVETYPSRIPAGGGSRQQLPPPSVARMRQAACRFVRSVARVYTSLSLELPADHKKKKRFMLPQPSPLDSCLRVFSSLAAVSLAELPKIAVGLLNPIRFGTLPPCVSLNLVHQQTDAVQGLEQVFNGERNAFNRRQTLLHSLGHGHAGGTNSLAPTQWRQLITRSNENTHSVGVNSASSSLPVSASGRNVVVSTLNVTLSPPGRNRRLQLSSPSSPTSRLSMNDPSVFTRQMQSTIRDIDQDVSVPVSEAASEQTVPATTFAHLHDHEYSRSEDAPPSIRPHREIPSDGSVDRRYRRHIRRFMADDGDESDSETVHPKRRRTVDGISTNVDASTSVSLDLQVLEEDDRHTLSSPVGDGENSTSQTSSTNATITTFGGSTLDNLDANSDVTNFSLDAPINTRPGESSYHVVHESTLTGNHVDPREITLNQDQNEFSYTALLNSESTDHFDQDVHLHSNRRDVSVDEDEEFVEDASTHNEDDEDTLIPAQSGPDFVPDDASDRQLSEFEEDDDDDDEEGEEGEPRVEEDDEDDENLTDFDEDHDEFYLDDDDIDELGDPEEEEDEKDDSSSSQNSDSSSADADGGSQAVSSAPWVPLESVYRFLSSSTSRSTTSDGGTSNRASVTDSVPSTQRTTSTSRATVRTTTAPVRRTVQSVLGMLSSSGQSAASNNTSTYVISGSGATPLTTSSTEHSSKVPASATSNKGACTLNTQVQLSRAFGLLIRVISDLIATVRVENEAQSSSHPLRRCASVPITSLPSPSVYQQQRLLPLYSSSVSTTSSSSHCAYHPNTLLLSSPMSTANLSSIGVSMRPPVSLSIGSHPIFRDLQSLGLPLPSAESASSRHGASTQTMVARSELIKLIASIGVDLTPIWQWLSSALDNLESRLRFNDAWNGQLKRLETGEARSTLGDGATDSNTTEPSTRRQSSAGADSAESSQILAASDSVPSESAVALRNRSDVLSYLLSIMRASSGDHAETPPTIAPQIHRHLAYVLDALLYLFKAYENAWPSGIGHHLHSILEHRDSETTAAPAEAPCTSEAVHEKRVAFGNATPSGGDLDRVVPPAHTGPPMASRVAQRSDSFFRRSESVLSLSGLGLDLIDTPLSEALPLALQPHRLHSKSTRTELFGQARFFQDDAHTSFVPETALTGNYLNLPVSQWGLDISQGGSRNREYLDQLTDAEASVDSDYLTCTRRQLCFGGGLLDSIAHPATLLSRWCMSLEFFGKHFSNDVGAEHRSYIHELGGFVFKETKFRKQMERIRAGSRRDLTLRLDRNRDLLLVQTIRQLNREFATRQSQPSSNWESVTPSASSGRSQLVSSQRPTSASQIAVALLLGTTTDSPLLGTLFGASPTSPSGGGAAATPPQVHTSLLSSARIKIVFSNEPGEGTGVLRSFFTEFSDAVLSTEQLPRLSLISQCTSAHTPTLWSHRQYNLMGRPLPLSRANSSLGALGRLRASPRSMEPPSTSTAATTTSSSVSISFYPSPNRTASRRARTSAWRRAGGLSASATPVYPTSSPLNRSPVLESMVASSPTHHPSSEDSTPVLVDEGTHIPGLSPGASPSHSQRGTSLSSSARTRSPSPELVHRSQGDDSQAYYSMGNRLYARVNAVVPTEYVCARITGMLMQLPATERATLLSNDDALLSRIDEGLALLTMAEAGSIPERPSQDRVTPSPPPLVQRSQPILERLVNWRESTVDAKSDQDPSVEKGGEEEDVTADLARVPLFWQPGLQGYYFPRAVPGNNVASGVHVDPVTLAARYSIYRGIGRVVGICLLFNETCPLRFNRPVLNHILGRTLHWHDFAFYDPTTYEGLRQLLHSTSPGSTESVSDYSLTFSLIPAPEEGGALQSGSGGSQTPIANQTYYLVPNGDQIEVTNENVFEFVKRYAEFKMFQAVREPLEQLRLGVFDVLPPNALDGLTAEDLRLLLNGAGDIDIELLASYTTYSDESGRPNFPHKKLPDNATSSHLDHVARVKRWFWSTVRSMDAKQRQNLLYFWTSSPAMPASAQGFQPMPNITIRPPDDQRLPTANTCISRLYLPLYSTKQILREKLTQAIEVKSFGFV